MRVTLASVLAGVLMFVVLMVTGCGTDGEDLRRLLWGDPMWDVVVCPHGAACESVE